MTPQIDTPAEQRRSEPERLRAFTDAVLAIIMTILVLEIGVPADLDDQSFREAVEETGPELMAWVISFLIVGMYWVWHRDLFNKVRYVNRDVVWLNLLFLLPASLIPFGASVLGAYHDEPIALHLYGAVMIVTVLFRSALYAYVMRRPELLWDPPTVHERRVGGFLAAVPIVVYLLAMAVADLSHQLSLALFLAMPLLYFLLVALMRDRPRTSEAAEDFG